jgi:hypothetical protein
LGNTCYISRRIPIKKNYLEEKMKASGAIKESLTEKLLIELFEQRVDSINWDQVKTDVLGFLRDKSQVSLWSANFLRR